MGLHTHLPTNHPPTTHQELLIGCKGDRRYLTSHVFIQCSHTSSDGTNTNNPYGLLAKFYPQHFVRKKMPIFEDGQAEIFDLSLVLI